MNVGGVTLFIKLCLLTIIICFHLKRVRIMRFHNVCEHYSEKFVILFSLSHLIACAIWWGGGGGHWKLYTVIS
jgi:hypothetical protein